VALTVAVAVRAPTQGDVEAATQMLAAQGAPSVCELRMEEGVEDCRHAAAEEAEEELPTPGTPASTPPPRLSGSPPSSSVVDVSSVSEVHGLTSSDDEEGEHDDGGHDTERGVVRRPVRPCWRPF
jgi:hypothetical protein